ncbi:MAG: alpha/beta fold hydrolase [Maricaulis sp.]|jgi:pimeloyl-ACP methyl ester carboxylesterase|uniref:alpha/beta hydrolase family protein n=1 Tax=Maricaulis sp. TaxID=1486257 RepID=UPI002612E730|nr:alpha/beta fold hydrolase [Maricaulis sp.]MDM7982890.1 alpha/beta fold hydrolase [Maricaulis sp.]
MPFHPLLSRVILPVLLSFLLSLPALAQAASQDWIGTLETPAGSMRLLVKVSDNEDGSQTAFLESLDQAPGQNIPVTEIVLDADQMRFHISNLGARYAGRWNADAQRYEGEFQQGMSLPLNFSRVEETAAVNIIDGLDGRWEAVLDREGTLLNLVLNIETGPHGTSATLDSVDQGVYDIPVTGLSRDADQVTLRVPMANVTFAAAFDAGTDAMIGDWTRPGFPDVQVTFSRTSLEIVAPPRPQTPQAPFPYAITEVRIDNPEAEGVTLAGTFTQPRGADRVPAVILVSGSGPQDRDESIWEHRPFAVLADHLSRQGVAVLRYDDRGFADSTGGFATSTSRDFASDAMAVLRWLRAQPGIDPNQVGVIGHSEGGLIAPIMAAELDAPDFLVLLAGPGTTGRQIVLEQSALIAGAAGGSAEDVEEMVEALEIMTAEAAKAQDGADVRARITPMLTDEFMARLGVPADQKELFLVQITRDWYVDFLNHDPIPYLQAVDQPVLAIIGSLDLQVPAPSNLAGLRRGLAHNADATILELKGLNHMFQPAQTGTIAEYAQIETTFDPEALVLISDWITERTTR